MEQIEDDGLVALAKTIIDRAEEKISLESELCKLRGFDEETDMILPGNGELGEFQEGNFTEDTDESGQDVVFPCEGRVAPIPEAVVLAKSMTEPPGKKGTARAQQPTQLLLFAYVS